MSENNAQQKEDSGNCGPGCACGTSGSVGRGRMIVGIVILAIAGVLVARAVIKNSAAQAANPKPEGFAVLPEPTQTNASQSVDESANVSEALKQIAGFSELNSVAKGSAGAFIYLPDKNGAVKQSQVKAMRGAAQTIEPQLHGKIGLFELKAGSADYDQIAGQMVVPGIIALVPGGRMVPVTGEITETKLIQGIAGSVQSCGAGGCGAGGCGSSGCN